jgi:hypothetical protein
METQDSCHNSHLAAHYGKTTAVYHGKGTLTLNDGREIQAAFEAGQLTNGDVLLLCDLEPESLGDLLRAMFEPPVTASKFVGTTGNGLSLTAVNLDMTNFLAKTNRIDFEKGLAECYHAFRVGELRVGVIEPNTPARSARFGLTNYCFDEVQAIHLSSPGEGSVELMIEPVKDGKALMNSVSTLKGIEVTSEVVATIPERSGLTQLTQVVDDICYLLSVARGTKIQWIYFDQFDESDQRLIRTHQSRVTRRYSPLAVIHGIDAEDGQIIDRTKVFVEQTYPHYVEKRSRFRFNSGTIDAYLEAKAESDLLEMRGVKLAVAMEMLKAVFLELPDCPAKEFIVGEEVFARYVPLRHSTGKAVLKAVIEHQDSTQGITGLTVQDLQPILETRKLEALNRTTFRQIMAKLFHYIGFSPGREEIALFVQCRNSLVHRGRFYATTATEAQRRNCPPPASLEEEYSILVNFLDRVFLKLLGYAGPYFDYRLPWNGGFGTEKLI